MELTRRDAVAALAAAGIAGGGALAAERTGLLEDEEADVPVTETMVAAAEAVYPTAVTGVREFVETYVIGRAEDRPGYQEGIVEATAVLNEDARTWTDSAFVDLTVAERDELLHEMSVDVVDPDPDGIAAERIRFYVVNELQYALYTSPTGGRLVGIENPQGHPGGLGSYQQGPGGGQG